MLYNTFISVPATSTERVAVNCRCSYVHGSAEPTSPECAERRVITHCMKLADAIHTAYNIQIVTGIEVNSEVYFPKLREYCPSAEGTRAIFPQMSGQCFPVKQLSFRTDQLHQAW